MGVIGLALLASLHFFSEMNDNYVLIARGYDPYQQVTDNYRFHRSKKGLIFSVSFLISATSFLVMVLLPNEEAKRVKPVRKAAPVPEGVTPPKAQSESTISSPMQGGVDDKDEDLETTALPEPRSRSRERESVIEAIEELDLEDVEFEGEVDITEGEDDVVYGSGEITAAALIDFVHKYPDSSLKFLFRRKLDGKPLSAEEEDIYAAWEARSLTRGKIKRYILQLMDWEEMPKEPLYEIWKKIRDHIFENYS
ncbi:MAG: hypothetical protein A2527_07355 [Candidatus Lambdaproteobacteria bacterium RIFOXYD2_FULL_50_16]|uniref:Uncharacterized protein n=1 Tax=Candidatus Lambdaproteobacteria bacterium RIFOXYD2_FULL_50_16 TaxID=1817772 RepID=A0A1F6GB49_9PROT|nr:MAG: hypothetical protein A2527_07355 [Candidatus Lambdaproteobacteria bacterium RIFOXYD2_FULL_50_16]